jgi:hypothetical protein
MNEIESEIESRMRPETLRAILMDFADYPKRGPF